MTNELSTVEPYSQEISRAHPGLILILLDQSQSMEEYHKSKDAADAVNGVIYEIVLACRKEGEVRDYCKVGVIGYGAAVEPVVGGWISELSQNPRELRDGKPIWVEPQAVNGTPMAEAFSLAHDVARKWANENPDNFPPILINISDGAPNDFVNGKAPSTERNAKSLLAIKTSYGSLLLFNAKISGVPAKELLLTADPEQLADPFAGLLCRISSILPDKLSEAANAAGFQASPGARGFVFNAATETLIRFLDFGTNPFKAEK